MEAEGFIRAVLALVPLLLSVTLHEYAHGYTAFKLGDTTAKDAGRLTLNPIAHLDLFGSIVLPIVLLASGLPPFGWARPVPVDPSRCTRVTPRLATILTSAAGPLSNVALAIVSAALLVVVVRAGVDAPAILFLLRMMLAMNVLLALFNLLPLPPLDGSRVVFAALPQNAVTARLAYARAGPIALIVVLLFGGRIISPPYHFLLDRISEALGVGVSP